MRTALLFLLAAVCVPALMTGCKREGGDQRHPFYRQAQHAKNSGDAAGAVTALRKALNLRPNSLLYHLELAEIYDEMLDEPLNAAYHYQEALALAPDSPEAPQIAAWCRAAQLRFIARHEELLREAAETALAPQREAAEKERAALTAENARLRAYIQTLKASLATVSARRAAEKKTEPVSSAPAAPASPVRHYTVQKGDTPGGIARKFYRDSSRFRLILEANRDIVKNERSLQIGMVLVIPPDPENP